jgi:hypothetical protein
VATTLNTALNPDPVQRAVALGQSLCGLPFDAVRAQYAGAVRAGLIQRSMLASRDFERAVRHWERLACGLLLRRV